MTRSVLAEPKPVALPQLEERIVSSSCTNQITAYKLSQTTNCIQPNISTSFNNQKTNDNNMVLDDITAVIYDADELSPDKSSIRQISKNPFKVLDAPKLEDDFYFDLVDWSSTNLLCVGLGNCVYLWSPCTSQVTKLCQLTPTKKIKNVHWPRGITTNVVWSESVTSVSWSEGGNYVGVGCDDGTVQVWDVIANKQINTLTGHTDRVGSIAWNGDLLISGSKDRSILQRDIRTPCTAPDRKLEAHTQEVCGLKVSPDKQNLASGGNDNKLFIWNMHSSQYHQVYDDHQAAVKAIAWSPHHHGLLASGGGTADRKIRFRNTLTGETMQVIETGSQISNLAWSKHAPELVSTHGWPQHNIQIWRYPSLRKVANLKGHKKRVLYMAVSPDGDAIVTGSGDETLRFWNVFKKSGFRIHSKL